MTDDKKQDAPSEQLPKPSSKAETLPPPMDVKPPARKTAAVAPPAPKKPAQLTVVSVVQHGVSDALPFGGATLTLSDGSTVVVAKHQIEQAPWGPLVK